MTRIIVPETPGGLNATPKLITQWQLMKLGKLLLRYFYEDFDLFYELPDESVMEIFVEAEFLKVETFDLEKHKVLEDIGDFSDGDDIYLWTYAAHKAMEAFGKADDRE